MKHPSPKLYYFSLDPNRVLKFRSWIGAGTENSLAYVHGARFSLIDTPECFNAADLSRFLDEYAADRQSLHVIVDMAGIPAHQAPVVCEAISAYPEVQFLFDRRKDSASDFRGYLFPASSLERDIRNREDRDEVASQWAAVLGDICVPLFEICWEDGEEDDELLIRSIICGRDNTFDAGNLRYAVKFRKCLSLRVDRNRNFSRIQDSRRSNLGICVEQQVLQNIHASYALYANGYRVLPVTSRHELERLGPAGFLKGRGVVLRGFDLQFEDEGGEPVDEIRGFKYCGDSDMASIAASKGRAASCYKRGWNDFRSSFEGRDNRYWKAFAGREADFPVYFVTEAPRGSVISSPSGGSQVSVSQNGEKLTLPGLGIPVCGIYHAFQTIPEVKRTYEAALYRPVDPSYRIDTSRNAHDHSAPLDLYEQASSMLARAEEYLAKGRFILAALVSGEAIEYMNGFHHRLMVKAYHICSKAENAMAMEIVGGNKWQLMRDTSFRVEKIKADVARFHYGQGGSGSENVLSQIFSDCRLFCKETEHFESENVFVGAMGRQLEGLRLGRLGDFPYIWIFFALLLGAALLAFAGLWGAAKIAGLAGVLTLVAILLVRPMNAVYGLMGAGGSIRMFFCTFLGISFLFAGVYQLGFFHDAGVSYDVNQPHIDYGLYAGSDRCARTVPVDGEELRYQPVSFWFTLRNTVLTTLMQEPTDFFSVASTFNEAQSPDAALDRQKASAFQWVLIFQILISWIFFGVFISLLYSKFRYES